MKRTYFITLAALCGAWSVAANADRDTGWEIGGELIYQDSVDAEFEGSTAALDSDLGIAVTFGYRINERLEVQMGLDWNNIDYNAHLVSSDFPGISVDVDGEMESFTPRVGVNFNFLEGDITPYVTGTIGYSFIDTNIPDGPPEIYCWWDPWYGEICSGYQSTHSKDAFMYGVGLGVRWDIDNGISMRLAYDKRWLDFDREALDVDQIKLGVTFRY